nr:hypothetical protein GCM10020093_021710 [Planobispora longispora]
MTCSSGPPAAVTTTFLSGRTVELPSAGLIFMTGAAGVAWASFAVSPVAAEGVPAGSSEQEAVNMATVTTARPAKGILSRRLSTFSTNLSPTVQTRPKTLIGDACAMPRVQPSYVTFT